MLCYIMLYYMGFRVLGCPKPYTTSPSIALLFLRFARVSTPWVNNYDLGLQICCF